MNIIVESNENSIKVTFNDVAPLVKISKTSYRRRDIAEITQTENEGYLTINMSNGSSFNLSFNQTSYSFVIESVDGTAPTSNGHLFDLLSALQL